MTDTFRKGGIVASILLIALGIGALIIGVSGRETVHSDLAREQIVGTPDSAIAGQKVDTGAEAKERVVHGAEPHREAPVQLRRRDEAAARGLPGRHEGRVAHRNGVLVVPGGAAPPEADDAERRGREQLERVLGEHKALGRQREVERSVDRGPEGMQSEERDREPDLQRASPATAAGPGRRS